MSPLGFKKEELRHLLIGLLPRMQQLKSRQKAGQYVSTAERTALSQYSRIIKLIKATNKLTVS